MNAHNFNEPSRQSVKGIIVIFGFSLYKIIRATIIVIAAFFFKYFQSDTSSFFSTPQLIVYVTLFLLFFFVLAILKYSNFKFHVNDSAFVLQKGILNKEEISVNKNKIQNVYIKQNVLQQIINVVSLSIETAGDDKTEIEIKALQRPKALALKALLLENEKALETIENKEKKEDDSIFFKASIKNLILEGISENHFKSFILILAFIVGIYQDLKDFFTQVDVNSRFNSYFQLDEASLFSILLFNVFILAILLVVAFLFSLIKTLVQNFDLKVTQKSDGFEISKGLLNKINLGLKTSRIQTTTIITNRFKKGLGLYQLVFTQAMVNKKQKQKFKIIGLKKDILNALIGHLLPSVFEVGDTHKPNKYLMYRLLYLGLIPLLISNIAFYFLEPIYFLLNIPLILVLVLNAVYRYKKAYYSFDEKYIVVGRGSFISTITTFAEIHKLQAVRLSQTLFQKRRNLATVKVYTAGKPLKIPHIVKSDAEQLKNYLLFKVESENKDWM